MPNLKKSDVSIEQFLGIIFFVGSKKKKKKKTQSFDSARLPDHQK